MAGNYPPIVRRHSFYSKSRSLSSISENGTLQSEIDAFRTMSPNYLCPVRLRPFNLPSYANCILLTIKQCQVDLRVDLFELHTFLLNPAGFLRCIG